MKRFPLQKLLRPAIFLALVIGVFCYPALFLTYSGEFPKKGIVEHVIDGDTVVLKGGEKLRYLGINAPEIRIRDGSQWILKPQIFGEKAKFLNQRLVEGKKIELEYDHEKRDSYKRLLAYVRVGEVFVNGELIRQGLALMDTRSPNLRFQKLFLNFQEEARRLQRGLWGKIAQNKISAQDAINHIGELGVVEGKITSVHFTGEKLYLNFGENFQKDFTCIIYQENLKFFSLGTNDSRNYFLKRKIHVYGVIKHINGPAMIICAPSQMDILD